MRLLSSGVLPKVARGVIWMRYVWLLAVVLAFAHAGYVASSHNPTDWVIFEVGARILVHYHGFSIYGGNPLHVYANNSELQIGPPALLPVAAAQGLSPHAVNVLFVVIMAVMGVAAIALLSAAANHLVEATDVTRTRVIALVAGIPLVAAWGYECGQFHHLDDALALLCMCLAAWLCASGRSAWLVGIALGISVATKPWAIVFAPMLLGLPRLGRSKAALALIATAAAFWGPFVVAAPHTISALGGLRIVPRPGFILWLLGLRGHVEHWLRPVQFTLGGVAAGYVALRGRWTAAPLVGIAVRVALDPFAYAYYGLGPVVAALAWDLTRPSSRRLPIWTSWTLFIEFGLRLFAPDTGCAIGRLVWVVSVLVVLLRAPRITAEPATNLEATPSQPAVLAAT